MTRLVPVLLALAVGCSLILAGEIAKGREGNGGAASPGKGGALPKAALDGSDHNATKARAAQTNFLRGPLTEMEFEIPDAGIEELRKDPRHYTKGNLRVGAKVWREVAIKLKGAQGSFQPVDAKPCFTLNFSKSEDGERFHGFRKAHLNNSREDPSFLRQQLCGEMVRAAVVPALRCTHAWVKLNGRELGLYVFTEGYTPDLLAPFFADPGGDLYEGGFCKDIDDGLTKDLGDPADFTPITALLAACAEDDPRRRWQKLRGSLDTDRFATFLSLETLLAIGDSYDFFHNNYRIYHDPRSGLLSFIPHGMDEPLKEVEFPIQRIPESIVGRAITSCAEGQALYRARVAELYGKVFQRRDWAAQVDAAGTKVLAFVAKHDASLASVERCAIRSRSCGKSWRRASPSSAAPLTNCRRPWPSIKRESRGSPKGGSPSRRGTPP